MKENNISKRMGIGALFGVLGALVIFSFFSEGAIEIPEAMFGKWVSTDPKYQDRHFYLSPYSLEFGRNDNSAVVYEVILIRADGPADEPFYTVMFADKDGNAYKKALYFENGSEPILRFKNQDKMIWRKEF